jgi:hypothetical protein
MWNAADTPQNVYYGANFVDYIGLTDGDLVMIRPANGKQYDSFIWGQYFATVVDGAAAADEVTLAAIAAIDALPETVSLEDKALVEAAREAYNKISTLEQRALVTNYSKLEKAEKRIQDLEYLESGDGTDTPDDGENNGGGFLENLPTSTWIAAGVAAGLLVVTVVFATLTVVFACLYIGKKNAPKKAAKRLPSWPRSWKRKPPRPPRRRKSWPRRPLRPRPSRRMRAPMLRRRLLPRKPPLRRLPLRKLPPRRLPMILPLRAAMQTPKRDRLYA